MNKLRWIEIVFVAAGPRGAGLLAALSRPARDQADREKKEKD
jgi:hypothetical protein